METLVAETTTTTHTPPLSECELEELKQLLLKKRANALSIIESDQDFLSDAKRFETEVFDDAIRSSGLEGGAREARFVSIARQRKFIQSIDRALERIKRGTYGICKDTGQPIPIGRLRAVPHTSTSIGPKRSR